MDAQKSDLARMYDEKIILEKRIAELEADKHILNIALRESCQDFLDNKISMFGVPLNHIIEGYVISAMMKYKKDNPCMPEPGWRTE